MDCQAMKVSALLLVALAAGVARATSPLVEDPCAGVSCSYGETCSLVDGKPRCACPSSSSCPVYIRYAPICGSDGNSYGDTCQMNIAACKQRKQIRKVSDGECPDSPATDKCAVVRCGYGATCRLVDGQAKCECPQLCTQEYRPVCGTDGKTYSNPCYLRIATCESQGRVQEGDCAQSDKCAVVRCGYGATCRVVDGRAQCKCPTVCPLIYKPVCGTDGKTYSNSCALNIAACESQGKIQQASEGECSKTDNQCLTVKCANGAKCRVVDGRAKCECPQACTKEYRPVCGTDGKTYSNPCLLRIATCESLGKIQQASEGKCSTEANKCANVKCGYGAICSVVNGRAKCECPSVCTQDYRPVCGSDGRTYSNPCYLSIANCQSNGGVELVAEGECFSEADMDYQSECRV